MRRFVLPAILVIALGTLLAWRCYTVSRHSPGASIFKDFEPRAIGKTWTIIGTPGSKHLAFVDPTGAIQPRRDSYSVHWFVYDRDRHKLYSPLLHNVRRQTRRLDGLSAFITWRTDEIEFQQTVFTSPDTCYSELRVRNASRRHKSISVFTAAVPYQVLGAMRSGYDVRYDKDSRSILVNGKVLLSSLLQPSDATAISDEQGTDVTCYLRKGVLPRGDLARGTSSRVTSGAMRFDLDLDPGRGLELGLTMPMSDVLPNPVQPLGWDAPGKAARADAAWTRCQAVSLTVPDRRVMDCWNASLAYLLMLSGGGKPVPGPAKYHSFWVRDAAYMADALYYTGQRGLIPPALAQLRAMQLPSGGFLPKAGAKQDDELDAPGEAIYAFVQQYRRTRDRNILRRAWPCILSACRYIRAKRGTDGILPPSVSAEDLGKGDQQHYWDDFWCVRGLRDAAFAARELGRAGDAAWMDAEAESLLRSTLASVSKLNTSCIPNGPQDLTSSAMARGTSCALWPCAVLNPTDQLTRASFDTYWSKWIAPSGGGFVHKGHYWPYAGMDLAQGYLMLGQRERAWKILDWTLDHDPTRGFYSWPEGMSRDDLTLAEGDMPHGWMCAGYLSLVRNVLVRESGRELVLLSGVPKQWLKPGVRISVWGFPTELGRVSYKAEVKGRDLKLRLWGAERSASFRVVLPGNSETVLPGRTREAVIPLRGN